MQAEKQAKKQPKPKTKLRFFEKGEENRIRNYFVRLFGKYDFRNETHFTNFAKTLLYLLLVLVEVLTIWQQTRILDEKYGKIFFFGLLSCMGCLTLSETLRLFVFKSGKNTYFSVISLIISCCMLFFADGTYPIVLYIIILSGVYIGVSNFRAALLVFLFTMPVYVGCYTAKMLVAEIGLTKILQDAFGAVLALSAHFIALHIALGFYRQYLRLHRTLKELDESKKELEKAYAVVAEVAVLEERQRIAKEIHDTAGHSLTTVIMQTESAKRILDKNPEEAKAKIVAANLQAKHALEELRDSVHLLSGDVAQNSLKTALQDIVNESTDGTGISIRSSIEEVSVSAAKFRFLCNTLKEGISNGLRHGAATAFWFEFKRENDELHFLLSDNGKGADKTVKAGFGLTTMQERARAFGGEVTFDSEPDEGFELRVVLPVDRKTATEG